MIGFKVIIIYFNLLGFNLIMELIGIMVGFLNAP
jgi:hypothetical protein